MPFSSKRQQRWAFATGQPFAKRWAKATPDFAALPEKKDAGVEAGAMLHGPGGLLATPGMRKWGRRRPRVTTKPMTRSEVARVAALARWGKYTPRPDAPVARGIALSKQPNPTHQAAPKPPRAARHTRGGGKKGAATAKPKKTDQQRQQEQEAKRAQREQERAAQHDANKKKVYAQLNIAPDGQAALEALRKGEQPNATALARGGFVAAGLVEQAADGSYRMTPSGRALMAAAESGDVGRAADITSAARDRQSARQARQAAAEARKQQVAARRAALASRRGGGGGKKKPAHSLSAAAQRSIDRTRQHLADTFARARRQTTKAASPGDYLIVEDRTKPTTWHLQVRRGDAPDHGLMGSAWAALHGGFRGNVYQGPGKQEAIAKLRALYKQEGLPLPSEKSFAVFKDARGAYRWIARTSTAYRDRDAEIVTTKALEADAARMTATGQYGPLRYWHIGQPDPFDPVAPWGVGLDIGDCDYSIVIGRTSIESGTFKSAAIGQAFAESADDYELSRGFFHPPSQPAHGEYETIRTFERSTVPVKYGRASNLFTGMTVKEHRMDQQTYEARVKAFMADMNAKGVPPEVAAQSLASMEQADKSATQQGIAYKSDDAPLVYYLGDGTPGLLQDGRFVALKAAPAETEKAPPMGRSMMDTEDDPAKGGDSGVDEAAEGEPPMDDPAQYIGDMTPAEFWAQLQQYLAPVLKMQDMVKAIGDHASELKTMYGGAATKEAGLVAEIAALKEQHATIAARLAQLSGDQPAVVENEALAALKSKGPQAPPDANAPQIPDDPSRPLAGLGAQLLPHLYGAPVPQVHGFQGANGWQFGQSPQNTGGN